MLTNFYPANTQRFSLKFLFIQSFLLFLLTFNQSQCQIKFSNIYNSYEPYSLKTDFSKQPSTWNWQGQFQTIQTNSSNFNWEFTELYSSTYSPLRNQLYTLNDQHNLNGLFYKSYNENKYGLYTRSWILLDKREDDSIEDSNHSTGFFSVFAPEETIQFTPYVGYQKLKNSSKTYWGWDTGINGKIVNYKLGDYNANFEGNSDYDFFETRKDYSNKFLASVTTQFSAYTSDSIKISYEESSKQLYNSATNNILEARIFNRQLQNNLLYAFSGSDIFSIETRLHSRNIALYSRRDEFSIENRFVLKHLGRKFDYELSFRTNDETLDNQNTITDSRTRESAIGFKLSYQMNNYDAIGFNMAYVKLQHDTPDEANKDDRDEQRFVMNLVYKHELSPVLFFMFDIYGFLDHQIYLFNPQSTNNNWKRIIKLSSEVLYTNGNFINRLASNVLANYRVYDFDDLFLIKRSFISRKYTISDSVNVNLSDDLSLGVYGRLEIEEKGNFFKKQFAQNLIQTYETKRFSTYISRRLLNRFNLKLGYNYYNRLEWRYNPVKKKYRNLVDEGPFVSILYHVINRLYLNAFTTIKFVNNKNSGASSYNTGYLKLVYNL